MQVLQILWPAALDKNILLVVLRGPVVDGQPLLVFIALWASCGKTKKTLISFSDNKLFAIVSYSFKEKYSTVNSLE